MKKVIIIFVIFFIASLVVPMFASFVDKSDSTNELVTIFSSNITLLSSCH